MKKMTHWGVGPKFALWTMVYAAFIYLLQTYIVPTWTFGPFHTIGIVVMVIGFLLFIYPAVTIYKYFNEGKLRTTGLYAYVRHPIYGAWIVFILPGIVLYWGSILGISIPFVAYRIFKRFIPIEEGYLMAMAGKEYNYYRKKVRGVIFPKFL